jgi:hypothetical protein
MTRPCLSALFSAVLMATACGRSGRDTNSGAGTAQTRSDSATPSKGATKLQAAAGQTGTVLILGYSEIGRVNGLYGTSVDIEARELQEPSTNSHLYGLRIHVVEGGTLERENASYVDYDEIEPLLTGLEYITNTNGSVTKLASFQADYRTRGDLVVSTFDNASDQIMAAIKSGDIGGARAYLSLSQLGVIRDLLKKARQKLDSIRPAAAPS